MVSRITGSVGKGLAAITMDKEFQQKRREEMNRAPKDFGESLAKGGKGLLKVATLLAPPPTPVSRPRRVTHSLTSCSFVCRGSWAESRVSSPSLWRVSKLRPHCLLICFLGADFLSAWTSSLQSVTERARAHTSPQQRPHRNTVSCLRGEERGRRWLLQGHRERPGGRGRPSHRRHRGHGQQHLPGHPEVTGPLLELPVCLCVLPVAVLLVLVPLLLPLLLRPTDPSLFVSRVSLSPPTRRSAFINMSADQLIGLLMKVSRASAFPPSCCGRFVAAADGR